MVTYFENLIVKLYVPYVFNMRVGLDSNVFALLSASAFPRVGPMHYSRDPQVSFSANITSNLSPTALFTNLKIILLQYFQFSAINGIQTDHAYQILFKSYVIYYSIDKLIFMYNLRLKI